MDQDHSRPCFQSCRSYRNEHRSSSTLPNQISLMTPLISISSPLFQAIIARLEPRGRLQYTEPKSTRVVSPITLSDTRDSLILAENSRPMYSCLNRASFCL